MFSVAFPQVKNHKVYFLLRLYYTLFILNTHNQIRMKWRPPDYVPNARIKQH